MRDKFDLRLMPPAPDLSFELPLWEAGVALVAGIDEAGRGALAGPVAAGVVLLPPSLPGASLAQMLHGVRDSKQMTPGNRKRWARQIRQIAMSYGVGFASNQEIDELGILPATRLAIERAIQALETPPQHLLLDYLFMPDCLIPQTSLVKGDARSLSIAAASILAKTARDAVLCELSDQYPGYGFAQNKGYGTLEHRQALDHLGYSPVHRLSFRLKVNR